MNKKLDITITLLSIILMVNKFINFVPSVLTLFLRMFFNAYVVYRYQHAITSVFFGSLCKKRSVRLVITLWAHAFLLGYFPIRTSVTYFDETVSFLYSIKLNSLLVLLTFVAVFPVGHFLWKRSNFKTWSGPIPTFSSRLEMGKFSSEWQKYKNRLVEFASFRFLMKIATGLVFSFLPIIFGFYLIVFHAISGLLTILMAAWLVYFFSNVISRRRRQRNDILRLIEKGGFSLKRLSFSLFPRKWNLKVFIAWFMIVFNLFWLSIVSLILTALFAGFSMKLMDYPTFFVTLGLLCYFLLPPIVYQFLFLVRLSRRIRPFMESWQLEKQKEFNVLQTQPVETLALRLPKGGILGFCVTWVPLYMSSLVSTLNHPLLHLVLQIIFFVWPISYLALLLMSLRKPSKSLNENVLHDNRNIPLTLVSQFAFLDFILFTMQLDLFMHALSWWLCVGIICLFYAEDYFAYIRRRFKGFTETTLQFLYFPAFMAPLVAFGYWFVWLLLMLLCVAFIIYSSQMEKKLPKG